MDTNDNPGGGITVIIDEPEGIGPRSRSIAEQRAIGLTHEQIAAFHGISEKTVQRTLAKADVQELVITLQSEMYSESTAQLLNLTGRTSALRKFDRARKWRGY